MEIYALILDATTSKPIPGAVVTRLYPDGQGYSSDLVADSGGRLDIPVPGRDYSAVVRAPGYIDQAVLFTGALDNRRDLPKVIKVTSEVAASTGMNADGTPAVVQDNTTMWLVGGLAVAGFIFRKQLANLLK